MPCFATGARREHQDRIHFDRRQRAAERRSHRRVCVVVRASASARTAVLDIGELYRLKETQFATVLVKRDSTDEDRALALKRAAAFGLEVTNLIQSLPDECRCLILARGAVVGPAPLLPDLTPEVRRRLGL